MRLRTSLAILLLAFSVPGQAELEIPGVSDPEFLRLFEQGIEEATRLWEAAPKPAREALLGPAVGIDRQKANRGFARFFLRVNRLECGPGHEFVYGGETRNAVTLPPRWGAREIGRFCRYRSELLYHWGMQLLGMAIRQPRSAMVELVRADAVNSMRRFEQAVRAYDPLLTDSEMIQAARNFMVAVGLQYMFQLPFDVHEAVIGYSLLYPYVDNLLDEPALDAQAKQAFAEKLFARLSGSKPPAGSVLERKVFDMVDRVYRQYPAADYLQVRRGLLTIFNGQMLSLRQQDRSLSPQQIRDISRIKGASSVLAGSFLVDPDLDAQRFGFAMRLGYLLQLIDDLEDMTSDHREGQRTQFSVRIESGEPADVEADRLIAYIERVLAELDNWPHPQLESFRAAMRGAMHVLLYRGIALQKEHFSAGFLRDVERFSPFALDDLVLFDFETEMVRFNRNVELARVQDLSGRPVDAEIEALAKRLTRHLH